MSVAYWQRMQRMQRMSYLFWITAPDIVELLVEQASLPAPYNSFEYKTPIDFQLHSDPHQIENPMLIAKVLYKRTRIKNKIFAFMPLKSYLYVLCCLKHKNY